MASPQIENGYTKIANELLDSFCAVSLSSHEWNVIHAIIRKTYGYNKKEDWVTNTQIMKLTGQTQQKVSQAKRKLIEKKIVTENGNKISLNKDYEKWSELPKTVTRVTENGNKQLPKTVNTKERKTITKEISEQGSANNKKDMSFKKQGDDADLEFEVDYDGDGTTTDLKAEDKKKSTKHKQERAKMRNAVTKIFAVYGVPKPDARQLNWHLKFYEELLDRGWSHETIGGELINTLTSDLWKERMQNGEYPGMNTVEYSLRNKKPK